MRNKINIFLHSLIFNAINSSPYLVSGISKSGFFSKWIVIDPKRTFRKNFPESKGFSFVQIGGNDGVSFDFLYSEVLKRDSKGLIVEPSPRYFKDLIKNYQDKIKINLVNKAIFRNNKIVELFEANERGLKKLPEWAKGVGSIDKDHLMKNKLTEDDIDVFEVEGITFMDLMRNYPDFLSVDYLQIDTEGYDFEILKLIDFSKFSCDFIRYEKANLSSSDLEKSEKLLKSNGYQIIGDAYDNFCFKSPLSFQLKYNRN